MNGIINVYKEKGYTSHDVVAKMRGILKMKKIGHTGTLDPDAEGVLPVCLGKATKLVDLITDKDKTYEAVLKLGVVTDTQDLTGQVLKTAEVSIGFPEIQSAIYKFIGEYEQLPPMYSAIKVNGKKLYELARQGKEIERKTRKVIIHDIRILDYSETDHEVRVSVDCAKGTYIRTLLHDIGETLGCGGAMKSLLRTKVGGFLLEDALKLHEIEAMVREDKILEYVTEVDDMFQGLSKIIVDREYHKLIYNGNSFGLEHLVKELQEQILEETQKQAQEQKQEQTQKQTQEQTQKQAQEQTQEQVQEQMQEQAQKQTQEQIQEQMKEQMKEQAQEQALEQTQKQTQEQTQKQTQEQTQKQAQEHMQDQTQASVPTQNPMSANYRVYDADDVFIGLYRFDIEENSFRPVKMFL